jgi:hypothetical protein
MRRKLVLPSRAVALPHFGMIQILVQDSRQSEIKTVLESKDTSCEEWEK